MKIGGSPLIGDNGTLGIPTPFNKQIIIGLKYFPKQNTKSYLQFENLTSTIIELKTLQEFNKAINKAKHNTFFSVQKYPWKGINPVI